MNQTEQDVIRDLFGKLATVETQGAPRDPEAERTIAESLSRQPNAPYYMAQTIVVQEHALQAANQRVADLERELSTRPAGGGGFLSSLFGGGAAQQQQRRPALPQRPMQQSPFQGAPQGGFLAGAMQTAVGVAGGVLLGNAVMSMFDGGEAQAAEPAPAEEDPQAYEEPEMDMGFGDEEF